MRKTILILLASLLLTGCATDPVSTTESTAATTTTPPETDSMTEATTLPPETTLPQETTLAPDPMDVLMDSLTLEQKSASSSLPRRSSCWKMALPSPR